MNPQTQPQSPGPTSTEIQPPNFNPSPRARYQATVGNITAHKQLLELPSLDRAADFAMLQLTSDLSETNTTSADAMANGYRLEGAKRFLSLLKTLAVQQQPASRPLTTGTLIDEERKRN